MIPHCHSNGAPWQTSPPGSILAVPGGTQVVATPSAYGGCGCSGGGSGNPLAVTGGASPSLTSPLSLYPTLLQSVEVPAVNSNFQIYSTGASQWALSGMRVWFPPFGYAEITGVTGDLVTLKNLDITLGTLLGQGSPLLAFPPPVPQVVEEVTVPVLALLESPLLLAQISTTAPGAAPEVTGVHALAGKTIAWLQGYVSCSANEADAEAAISWAKIEVNGRLYQEIRADGNGNHYFRDIAAFPVRVVSGQITYKLNTFDATVPGDESATARLYLLGSQ